MLMRIPGVGTLSAMRIVRQRQYRRVEYEDLKRMGAVLKRAKYFLTCNGMFYGGPERNPEALRALALQWDGCRQLHMFEGKENGNNEGLPLRRLL